MRFSRRPALTHTEDRESATSARCRLALLLSGATDEALERMTPESLAATHRVKPAEAEAALVEARARRARR